MMAARSGRATGGAFAVRRRDPAPARRRAGLALLVLLAVGLGAWGVHWALHSRAFVITRIETGSYRFTDRQRLDEVLGAFLGRNLLQVDRREVTAAMSALPWVRDMRIQRRLPGSLAVDFREWRPLAVLGLGDLPPGMRAGTWLLAENGSVLPLPGGMQVPALPTVLGLEVRDKDGTASCDSALAAPLLDLFAAMAASGLEAAAPVDFVVVEPEGYAIVLADGQGTLQVGRKEFGPRLKRYLAARPHLEPGLEVDLRFADRVTVRRPDRKPPGRS